MSNTTTASAPPPVLPARGRPGERRLRVGQLSAAIALIAVGGLGTAALVTAAAAEGTYLAVTEDVAYGAVITSDDLVTVRVSNPPELRPVAANDLDRVVGHHATMPLAAGTLLTPAHVTEEPVPGRGQHVVGITLRGERLPARRPAPGDAILLVATPDRTGDDLDTPTWPATVAAISGQGGGLLDGNARTVTLDVAVPSSEGPQVARLAAANRLVIVLDGDR